MREIGSEFALETIVAENGTDRFENYTFLGRYAIRMILDDILAKKPEISVLLPSYCCDSIVNEFRRERVSYSFYRVDFNGGFLIENPADKKADVLYAIDYFGYASLRADPVIEACSRRGMLVIEDMTHSIFSSRSNPASDYVFASLRKWLPVIGGACFASKDGKIANTCYNRLPDRELLKIKTTAMRQKAAYLRSGEPALKALFLSGFNRFNDMISAEHAPVYIDDDSRKICNCYPLQDMISTRYGNSSILHKELKNMQVQTMGALTAGDCPLFVPILLASKAQRDSLRQTLTSGGIYCPVHWPRPESGPVSNIYDRELSLVCDQRYDAADMYRMIEMMNGVLSA